MPFSTEPVSTRCCTHLVLGADEEHVGAHLVVADDAVGYRQARCRRVQRNAQSREQARQKQALGIGHYGTQLQRTAAGIEPGIGEIQRALVRVAALGLQTQHHRNGAAPRP